MAALFQIILLIINAGSTFLGGLLLMRFFMQLCRAPFDTPAGGFVLSLTNWMVLPLRRVIPAIRRFDTASLVAAYLLQILLLTLVFALSANHALDGETLPKIAIDGVLVLVRMSTYLYIILMIAQAMLSWFNPHAPLGRLIGCLTAPVLAPLQRVIRPISGIDLTPMIAILLAQIILRLV